MELLCNEGCTSTSVQRSYLDSNLLNDNRVLERLLKLEDHYIPRCDYFKIVQKEIKPHMRKLVVTWMFEVIVISMLYLKLIIMFSYIFEKGILKRITRKPIAGSYYYQGVNFDLFFS